VEACGVPSLLFNLAYGDVGWLSPDEDIIMRFPFHRRPPATGSVNSLIE
jgi:hypothetical protein